MLIDISKQNVATYKKKRMQLNRIIVRSVRVQLMANRMFFYYIYIYNSTRNNFVNIWKAKNVIDIQRWKI